MDIRATISKLQKALTQPGKGKNMFRGKRESDGKWIKGDQTRCTATGEICKRRIRDDISADIDMVEPETVCEYTGYRDLRKKEVFEHDIVFCEENGYHGQIIREDGKFMIAWEASGDCLRRDIHFWFAERRMYVVGNIFDNSEMLEEWREK